MNIIWRRLDIPGHDACRLVETDGARRIEGAAVFRRESGATALVYQVEYDREWRTREGTIRGWAGSRIVDLQIKRSPDGIWTLNGKLVRDLEECVDLDLGFTPATNLAQLRRIALRVGDAADVPVAWIDPPSDSMVVVRQKYERRSAAEYWYESPQFDYAAMLEVNATGFVERYPKLWASDR